MVAARLRLESGASRRSRTAVRGDPMAELRIGANETAARVCGNPVVVTPFAVHHMAHRICSFSFARCLLSESRQTKKALSPRPRRLRGEASKASVFMRIDTGIAVLR